LSRPVRILAAAAREAAQAKSWYELARPGLGVRFEKALNVSLDLLEQELVPLATWPGSAGKRGVMHLILRRFPFSVVVQETPTELVVIAFAHHSKSPGYWISRIST